MSDGKRELIHEPFLKAINLFSGDRKIRGAPMSPIEGGSAHRNVVGPEMMLQQGEVYDVDWIEPRQLDGIPVVEVKFTEKNAKDPAKASGVVFAFDPARGYLRIRTTSLQAARVVAEDMVTAARALPDGKWFPERRVHVFLPKQAGGTLDVTEIRVLELEHANRPERKELEQPIPAGTFVLEFGVGKKDHWFRLKQDEKIHPADISRLFDLLEKKISTLNQNPRPLMDTAIPRPSPYKWIGIAAGGFILLAGVGMLVVRRWRSRTRAT
jgi:hypothetical protein